MCLIIEAHIRSHLMQLQVGRHLLRNYVKNNAMLRKVITAGEMSKVERQSAVEF